MTENKEKQILSTNFQVSSWGGLEFQKNGLLRPYSEVSSNSLHKGDRLLDTEFEAGINRMLKTNNVLKKEAQTKC